MELGFHNRQPSTTASLKLNGFCSFHVCSSVRQGIISRCSAESTLALYDHQQRPTGHFHACRQVFCNDCALCGGPGMCNCSRSFCWFAVCSPRLPLRSELVICESSLSVRAMPCHRTRDDVGVPVSSRHEARCKKQRSISQNIWPAQLLLTHYNLHGPRPYMSLGRSARCHVVFLDIPPGHQGPAGHGQREQPQRINRRHYLVLSSAYSVLDFGAAIYPASQAPRATG